MQRLWSGSGSNFIQTLSTFLVFVLTKGLCESRGQRRLGLQERHLQALPEPEVVYPVKVDHLGRFLSHDVSHQVRRLRRRELTAERPLGPTVYYKLSHKGRQLYFNLTVNQALLAPGFVAERRYGGVRGATISRPQPNSCHLIGRVQAPTAGSGIAAISTCHGLKGVFRLSDQDYLIEPVEGEHWKRAASQPHVIYKRHAAEVEGLPDSQRLAGRAGGMQEPSPSEGGMCGVSDSLKNLKHLEKKRERWEKKQERKRRIKQRSISKERWVETLVVADTKMVEHHGSESIEAYVFTIMNMVAGLFRDASIGNSVNIIIVRLVLLEEDEEDLKITHHADNTLRSFCKWQKKINFKGDSHPAHHDVALLLTRKDVCAGMNRPCETLGLSHVSGMCQPHRSCSINEDTGLPLAFTVAHELGHNFGIQHDGTGNDCEPIGKRPFIMSPQLLYDTSPLTWSRCSREYITRFLDRGWGLCLDDRPAKEAIELPSVAPGVLYDANHQCRLQYGAKSAFCDNVDNVCNTLWCIVGNTCHSKLDAAVDGTKCADNKRCFDGQCVPTLQHPQTTDGKWGAWSSWSSCSRTCGAGTQSAERHCNNPTPKYGGSYCLGERKRFRICNVKACGSETPSFRHLQCSQFDAMPYKGKLHKWIPVLSRINPCELHCRPVEGYFAVKMLDAVTDGTPCFEGNTSRDMCINGICKNVGCDYEIDSNAVEDRCGVCQGNGSTCETVKKTFNKSEGLGYVDIGLIPEGAREIRIEEVAEAGNFLALRSDDPEKYFLNGGWIIQWNGDYKVAGTTFTYERNGNLENLTSPGPTREPVWIQLLFQETNPGVRFEYTVRRDLDHENEIPAPEFFWRYGLWTECSATCGGGVQRQIVHCLEKIAGIVEEQYCELATRPDDRQRNCHTEPCPARWWVGEWQACSASCGETGTMRRTTLCIQSVGLDEQRALQPSDCQHTAKPEDTGPCNREIPCPSDWSTGNWPECSVTCGQGVQERGVVCLNNTNVTCSLEMKPAATRPCHLKPCPGLWPGFTLHDWSGSGASSKEMYNEVGFNLNFGPGATNEGENSNRIPPIPNSYPSLINAQTPQPQTPEDNKITNHIIEDDFTKSEESSKPNIFVDDFYYDYNFINFHEDLEYGPEGWLDFSEEEKMGEDSKPEEEHLETNNISDSVLEKSPNQNEDGTSVEKPGSNELDNVPLEPTAKILENKAINNNQVTTATSNVHSVDIHLSEEYTTENLRVTEATPGRLNNTGSKDVDKEMYEADELLPVENTTVKEGIYPGSSPNDDQDIVLNTAATLTSYYHNSRRPPFSTSPPSTNIPSASTASDPNWKEKDWNSEDHGTSHGNSSGAKQGSPYNRKAGGLREPPESEGQEGNLESRETVNGEGTDPVQNGTDVPGIPSEISNVTVSSREELSVNHGHSQQQDTIVGHPAVTDNSWRDLHSDTSNVVPTPPVPTDPKDIPAPEEIHWTTSHGQTWSSLADGHSLNGSLEFSGGVETSPGNVLVPGASDEDTGHARVLSQPSPSVTQADVFFMSDVTTSGGAPSPEASQLPVVGTIPVTTVMSPELDSPLQDWATTEGGQGESVQPVQATASSHLFVHLEPSDSSSTSSVNVGTRPVEAPSLTSAMTTEAIFLRTTTSTADIVSGSNLTTVASDSSTQPPFAEGVTEPSSTLGSPSWTTDSLPREQIPTTLVESSKTRTDLARSHAGAESKGSLASPGSTDAGDAGIGIGRGSPGSIAGSSPVSAPTIHLPGPSGHTLSPRPALGVQATETDSVRDAAIDPASEADVESLSYWVVGNWSECSTTCGLGAIWRTVQCSSGRDSDCDKTKRPVPARRCYIRPCSAWHVGNWSRCSKNCGGGVKIRDVQCIDVRDRRPLRPFHCQPVLHKPPTSLACNSRPCLDWYTSSWGECSLACGGGVQERLVMCPKLGHCEETLRQNGTRVCNSHPCTKWMKGSWGQCTAMCGGGIQRRLVKCVNTVTGQAEEDSSQCDHEPWPENTQKCNVQECNSTDHSYTCKRNRLTFAFCQTLKLLGRCYLQTVQAQCCKTCQRHEARDRGNERISRR
ncbi:A disintegrin and metalloproteinase with thrombospondin motifs 7-like [Hypanus sabinus]|uniref:A disintegrin and metalloproteinase with thrombospondin motifs 7-like n=1 Tax=Hypanus sabinus TaxID=79690 RepID=UPI0028C469A9|nr:A disintegrin and metalloproteinase with thrombospondin motifs 7-like [Hypanus sabinus]